MAEARDLTFVDIVPQTNAWDIVRAATDPILAAGKPLSHNEAIRDMFNHAMAFWHRVPYPADEPHPMIAVAVRAVLLRSIEDSHRPNPARDARLEDWLDANLRRYGQARSNQIDGSRNVKSYKTKIPLDRTPVDVLAGLIRAVESLRKGAQSRLELGDPRLAAIPKIDRALQLLLAACPQVGIAPVKDVRVIVEPDPWRWIIEPTVLGPYAVGMLKYGLNNWKNGSDWNTYFSALLRHATAYAGFESIDPEDGFHHLGAVIMCALTLKIFDEKKLGHDNRPQTNVNFVPLSFERLPTALWRALGHGMALNKKYGTPPTLNDALDTHG
ncbi:MAG: dATP/dGTP diphosphohydrolase domain-containing protein, partial [Pseudomonadota bacterium]|nr:dATP/dGTP diphosphohydrolase domain-containing protein [Pseudomonadota bacterium]